MGKYGYTDKAICPYYHGEDGNAILCEGLTENSLTRQTFRCRAEMKNYRQEHCEKMHCRCAWEEALNKKYGYEK